MGNTRLERVTIMGRKGGKALLLFCNSGLERYDTRTDALASTDSSHHRSRDARTRLRRAGAALRLLPSRRLDHSRQLGASARRLVGALAHDARFPRPEAVVLPSPLPAHDVSCVPA